MRRARNHPTRCRVATGGADLDIHLSAPWHPCPYREAGARRHTSHRLGGRHLCRRWAGIASRSRVGRRCGGRCACRRRDGLQLLSPIIPAIAHATQVRFRTSPSCPGRNPRTSARRRTHHPVSAPLKASSPCLRICRETAPPEREVRPPIAEGRMVFVGILGGMRGDRLAFAGDAERPSLLAKAPHVPLRDPVKH
jgi:hypothetical protein